MTSKQLHTILNMHRPLSVIFYTDFLPDSPNEYLWWFEENRRLFFPIIKRKLEKELNRFWEDLHFSPRTLANSQIGKLDKQSSGINIRLAFLNCRPFLDDLLRETDQNREILLLPFFPLRDQSGEFGVFFRNHLTKYPRQSQIHYHNIHRDSAVVANYLSARYSSLQTEDTTIINNLSVYEPKTSNYLIVEKYYPHAIQLKRLKPGKKWLTQNSIRPGSNLILDNYRCTTGLSNFVCSEYISGHYSLKIEKTDPVYAGEDYIKLLSKMLEEELTEINEIKKEGI